MCKAIKDLMEDSRKEGIEEGREEGKKTALIETAKKLLDVLSDEVIAEKTELPLKKVRELRAELLENV